MKRRLLSLTLALVMALSVMTGLSITTSAEDVLAYTLDGTITGGSNGYATESDIKQNEIDWKVTGNTTISPWRIGGNTLSSVDRTVYSKTAMGFAITKVELTVGAASGITVNSLKLIVASNADFTLNVDEVTKTFTANSTITFQPTSSATSWASGAFYKFVFNVTVSGTSNKFVEFKKAEFYKTSTEQACEHNNLTSYPAVAPTCTTDGNDAYWTCNDCQAMFSDANHQNKIDAIPTIAALRHNWVAGSVTSPTCTENGYTSYSCSRCDATKHDDEVPATGHTDGNGDGKCDICGAAIPPSFALFTGTITEGDYIIYYSGKAMNTTTTSNRLQYAEVTPANDVITTNNAAIVWHIAPSGNYWTIYNETESRYAAATGTKNQAQLLQDGTDDKALWTIEKTNNP